jgi:hypothetical protein
MPYAACDECDHVFVVDDEEGHSWHCPRCHRPMRASNRTEALACLDRIRSASGSSTESLLEIVTPGTGAVGLDDTLRESGSLVRRARTACSEVKDRRDALAARVLEARTLRREMMQSIHEMQSALEGPTASGEQNSTVPRQ